MLNRQTEWFIRVTGGGLLLLAFYKLYTRPLTHSYHDAFLFTHLQAVLFVMLLLILALIAVSFEQKRWRGLTLLLSFLVLAPYPCLHQLNVQKAERHFFEERISLLESLNQSIIEERMNRESVYYRLVAHDFKAFEKGDNYIAYWVDRMPEQRDGFVFLIEGKMPERLFKFPLRRLEHLKGRWYAFSAG
jgi:hypothetical protein